MCNNEHRVNVDENENFQNILLPPRKIQILLAPLIVNTAAKIPSKLKSKMKAAGEREGEGSGREMHRDRENSSFRERSKESDGKKEGSREKDGESHRDRSKDSSRDKDSENRKDREGLQVNASGTRLPSRSQSPALTDLRMDQIPVASQVSIRKMFLLIPCY